LIINLICLNDLINTDNGTGFFWKREQEKKNIFHELIPLYMERSRAESDLAMFHDKVWLYQYTCPSEAQRYAGKANDISYKIFSIDAHVSYLNEQLNKLW
jgi:hypothetical protein